MEDFCNQLLEFGTLKPFQYFSLYLRGREELQITVVDSMMDVGSLPSSPNSASRQGAGSQKELLAGPRGLGTNNKPSPGFVSMVGAPPPASPAINSVTGALMNPGAGYTMFLVGGYVRYMRPYVWLRSDSQRFETEAADADGGGGGGGDKDNPLKLHTTSAWKQSKCTVWAIVAELLKKNMQPRPANVFAIDFDALSNSPPEDILFATATLMQFLKKILTCAAPELGDIAPPELLLADLQRVSALHFEAMGTVAALFPTQSASPGGSAPGSPARQPRSPGHYPGPPANKPRTPGKPPPFLAPSPPPGKPGFGSQLNRPD